MIVLYCCASSCGVTYCVYLRDNLACIQPLYMSWNSSGHSGERRGGGIAVTLNALRREARQGLTVMVGYKVGSVTKLAHCANVAYTQVPAG